MQIKNCHSTMTYWRGKDREASTGKQIFIQ